MAAEYEVNIKLNSKEIETQLRNIDKVVSRIGKPKGGGSRKKAGIAGLLPSSEDLKAAEKGIVQLTAKTKAIQGIQDKFSERRIRALTRSNTLNEKELRINKQLTAEARSRLRLLSQAGAKGFEAGRPQGRQLANDINARAKAQEKRAKLANKINEMEARGLNVAKLRKQLGKATTEQAAGRFAGAQKEFRLLQKTIELENSKLRILREQTTQKRFAASPIRGTATMMGSPAQIAASGRQLASPIRGGVGFSGSPAQMQAIEKLERAEIRAAKNAHMAKLRLVQKRQKVRLDNIDKLLAKDVRALESFDKRLKAADDARARRLAGAPVPGLGGRLFGPAMAPMQGAAFPIGGTAGVPGSPEFQRALEIGRFRSSPIQGAANIPGSPEAKRVRRQRLEQVGLGAGFPLLFGGGAGSVLGGGLGGLTGSFGAQIAFSAIGQQIDQFVAGVVEAGKALTSVGGAADFMAEKSLFSSDAMQFRIEKLLEEGRVTEAAALMTEEMAKQVGGSGLKALKDLGTEANKMGKLFNTLIVQVQAFIAQGLTPLLAAINKVVGNLVLNNQFNTLMQEATGERAKQIEEFLKPFTRQVGGQGGARTQQIISEEGKRLAVERFGGQVIPKGAAIEPTGLEVLRARDKGSDKAAEEKERIDKRIARLEEERKKVLDISRFRDRIAAAEAADDPQLAIRLKGEQKIAEIEAQRKKDLIGITEQRLIDQTNILSATKKLAAQRDTERQITEEQSKREAIFENKLTAAENEGRLLQAQLDGRLEEEQLLINIEQLTKNMSDPRAQQLENQLQQNAALKKQVELSEKLDKVYEQIESTLATGLSSALQSVINKTESLGDAVKGVLADIGNMLLRLGIETAVKAGFSAITSSFNSPSSSSFTPLPDSVSLIAATGAYVSGPTNAIIGEGGQGEYVIPESKMRESMARYSRGARGSSVIPESGESGTVGGDGGGTAIAAPIDVRYTVERINDVEYVTAAQFQAGMQQAAAQGAQRGEQQTLRRLQMSGSTRRRIGL
nr:phage tail tape measure protein [uncultured Mediterranean phage MEDS2 group]